MDTVTTLQTLRHGFELLAQRFPDAELLAVLISADKPFWENASSGNVSDWVARQLDELSSLQRRGKPMQAVGPLHCAANRLAIFVFRGEIDLQQFLDLCDAARALPLSQWRESPHILAGAQAAGFIDTLPDGRTLSSRQIYRQYYIWMTHLFATIGFERHATQILYGGGSLFVSTV